MQPKITLTVFIQFRTPKDIEEVQRLTAEIGTHTKQAGVYLAGLRAIAKAFRKEKG